MGWGGPRTLGAEGSLMGQLELKWVQAKWS